MGYGYRKYKHNAKRYAGAASGAALGYIANNLGGAYLGGKYAWDYVGAYQPPFKHRLATNTKNRVAHWTAPKPKKPPTGSNPPWVRKGNVYSGTRRRGRYVKGIKNAMRSYKKKAAVTKRVFRR